MDDLVRWAAAAMAVVNAVVVAIALRWERHDEPVEMRSTVRAPLLVRWFGGPIQVIPFAFPVLVAIAPTWMARGPLTWAPHSVVATLGVLLWLGGLGLALWSESAIRAYAAVDGVTVGHRLVTAGPYRSMRHPMYTGIIAVAIGTALVFASWLAAIAAVLSLVLHLWWASAEERLLSADPQLGGEYRAYASRTGRFLPQLITRRS